MRSSSHGSAFTLIELLTVIAIIAIIAAVLGFGGSFAWKTRPLTTAMARKAGKRINDVRDGHWLNKNPIKYG